MPPLKAGYSLAAGLALTTLSLAQLWILYISVGGNRDLADLGSYLKGTVAWPDSEHDSVAQALNEHCTEIGLGAIVAYAAEILGSDPGAT